MKEILRHKISSVDTQAPIRLRGQSVSVVYTGGQVQFHLEMPEDSTSEELDYFKNLTKKLLNRVRKLLPDSNELEIGVGTDPIDSRSPFAHVKPNPLVRDIQAKLFGFYQKHRGDRGSYEQACRSIGQEAGMSPDVLNVFVKFTLDLFDQAEKLSL